MPISPELLKIMKERMRGTMMELIGFLPVEVSKERVVAELPFRDDLTQPTGLLHAGAILTLANTAAPILANQNTMPRPGKFASPGGSNFLLKGEGKTTISWGFLQPSKSYDCVPLYATGQNSRNEKYIRTSVPD